MGLLGSIVGIKNDLVGKDDESTTTTGPTSGTKNTTDSGQTTSSNTTNSGSTNTSSGTTTNSGGTNTSSGTSTNTTSGSTNTNLSTVGSRTDSVTTGPTSTTRTVTDAVDTSQLMLTQEAVDYLIKGILESNSGLASLTGAPKGAGIYDATTTQMLSSDLLARTAGEVAARSAVTKSVRGGFTDTTTTSGSTTTTKTGSQSSMGVNTIGGNTSTSTSSGSQTTGPTTSTSTGSQQVGGSSSTTTGSTGPRTIQEIANTSGSSTNTAKDEKGLLDWIVCTELHKQGRMSTRMYRTGGRQFLAYDDEILKGYYLWAVPSVRHLRTKPNSRYSKFLEHVFNSRGRYLMNPTGCSQYDACVAAAVWVTCKVLSLTFARKYNYTREVPNG